MRMPSVLLAYAALLALCIWGQDAYAAPVRLDLSIGAYYNMALYPDNTHAWEDGGSPVATFALSVTKGNTTCELVHTSNWFTGAPLNDQVESTLDMIGCRYRINLMGG